MNTNPLKNTFDLCVILNTTHPSSNKKQPTLYCSSRCFVRTGSRPSLMAACCLKSSLQQQRVAAERLTYNLRSTDSYLADINWLESPVKFYSEEPWNSSTLFNWNKTGLSLQPQTGSIMTPPLLGRAEMHDGSVSQWAGDSAGTAQRIWGHWVLHDPNDRQLIVNWEIKLR